jgi:GNAT superfamily N-acetyltransferase
VGTDHAISALERNLWSLWQVFGRGDGGELVDTPEVLRFETPMRYIPYNSVMRFRVDGPDVDDRIDETLERYVGRGVPLMWVVHPTALPLDLDRRLEQRGLVEAEVAPGMVADLADVPPPDAPPDGIELARFTEDEADDFIELVAWRYSLPLDDTGYLRTVFAHHGFGRDDCPTKAWVARMDGRIVSKAILHVDGDGVAGLYGVATRAEARKLGLARILCSTVFDEARAIGCTTGVLHSTPMAYPLYESLGFRPVADFRLYSTPNTLHL